LTNYDFDFNLIKDTSIVVYQNWDSQNEIIIGSNTTNDLLPVNLNGGVWLYNLNDISKNKQFPNANNSERLSKKILVNSDSSIYWITNNMDKNSILKSNQYLDSLWNLNINLDTNYGFYADTLNGTLKLFVIDRFKDLQYYSILGNGTIELRNHFVIDQNIKLKSVKAINNDLIMLYGFKNDNINNCTYAYFSKYIPSKNLLIDTLIYSRTNLMKVERINNSQFVAFGTSRGTQGFLILDTNLNRVDDIRVVGLYGEIKDMLYSNNYVYLFSALAVITVKLPDEIIANVEDTPKIISDKLTHSAYPNPASDMINLRVMASENANYSIKLFDIYGTEILNIYNGFLQSQTEKIFNIPTSKLPIGSYYYVINGGGIVKREKVLVVR